MAEVFKQCLRVVLIIAVNNAVVNACGIGCQQRLSRSASQLVS